MDDKHSIHFGARAIQSENHKKAVETNPDARSPGFNSIARLWDFIQTARRISEYSVTLKRFAVNLIPFEGKHLQADLADFLNGRLNREMESLLGI